MSNFRSLFSELTGSAFETAEKIIIKASKIIKNFHVSLNFYCNQTQENKNNFGK